MSILRRAAAYTILISVYSFTWLVAIIGGIIPRRSWKPTGRIMVTGTFHNPNWYLSHITPLARSGVKEVILVVDEPQLPLERVRFVCPPLWVARLLTRAGAKALWMIIAGLRYRPDLYMGYHIAPGACSALVAGKLLGRPACYQMGGGPVEIEGGGFKAGDGLGRFLGHPSKFIERTVLAVVNSFDLVVVRGQKAKEFLSAHLIDAPVVVVTGSIQKEPLLPQADRDIHIVFVGRLATTKQVDQFIAVVGAVARFMPSITAAIVGDGPLMESLKSYAVRLGLSRNICFLGKTQNVTAVLLRSKVFVLTSRSEGMSIAMLEAMAAGAVPVVADVGELGDLVVNDSNGYLVQPDCIGGYAERIIALLQDPALWNRLSHAARETAQNHCSLEVIAQKWRQYLGDAVAHGWSFQGQGLLE